MQARLQAEFQAYQAAQRVGSGEQLHVGLVGLRPAVHAAVGNPRAHTQEENSVREQALLHTQVCTGARSTDHSHCLHAQAAGAAADAEELARYGITDTLCEFVSGCTYSTFR